MSVLNAIVRHAFSVGYRVTDAGTLVNGSGTLRADCPDDTGYRTVSMRLPVSAGLGNNPRRLYLHKLAAYQQFGESTFAKGIQVRHLNEDKRDNRPTNIGIGTQSDNSMDQPTEKRKRRAVHASKPLRRFSDDQMATILADRADGMTYKQLGVKYDVGKSTLSYLINRGGYAV